MSSPVRLQRPSNLSLDGGKSKSRVTFKEDSLTSQTRSTSTTTPSPRKIKYDADFRAKRKRAHSCSFYWDHFSKRRKANGAIVLPTKFLLGGNITDPLNLEALDKGDDIAEKAEATFTAAYKRSSTVRVIIPPNINDPLNLDACSEDGEEQLADAISRQRRRRKSKKRKRRNSEPGGLQMFSDTKRNRLYTSLDDTNTPRKEIDLKASTLESSIKDVIKTSEVVSADVGAKPTTSSIPVSDLVTPTTPTLTDERVEVSSSNDSKTEPSPVSVAVQNAPQQQQQPITSTPRYLQLKKQRTKSEDKIVSPVVPQPGVERKRHFSHQRHPSISEKLTNPKQFNIKNQRFQYGNYNQYYGYRNAGNKADPRLKLLDKELFKGKEVLDIGCNIGHITLSIGRDFDPQRIVGIDIDKKLVNIAQKNIHHYVDKAAEGEDEYPRSMKLLYGSLKAPVKKTGQRKFPFNVKFYQSNYVLENDALLEIVSPEFDVILCLSVTKWVHLNWGDEGLKRFFKRIFKNLKSGGMLVLEPQSWPSYNKKRKLTSEIFENYKKIKFFPNQFGEFLTCEVGFTFVQKCSVSHYSRGFERPVYIYKKVLPESVSTSVEESGTSSKEAAPQMSSNVKLDEVDVTSSQDVQTSKQDVADVPEVAKSAVDCSTSSEKESISLDEKESVSKDLSDKASSVVDQDPEVIDKESELSDKNKVVCVADLGTTVPIVCEADSGTTVPSLVENTESTSCEKPLEREDKKS